MHMRIYPSIKLFNFLCADDSTPPNYERLWKNYDHDSIGCIQSLGFVCVKWISYYNGEVDYTTHACSRVTVEGEGPMTSGCVTSMANNSRTIEVCACTSFNDAQPCNSGQHPYTSLTVTSLLMVFFLALKCVT
jgi:hypothetical protein